MNRVCKTVSLIAFVVLLSAGPAFTQAPSTEENSNHGGAPVTVASIYVQTHQGVNVYDATAAGKLTLVKGSPFATIGQMGGTNGKYLISVGTDLLRSYAIESTGAIGKTVAEINTQDYSGSECGNNTGAGLILDRTGKYLYISMYGALYDDQWPLCQAWQSYQIAPDGALTFLESLYMTDYLGYADGSAVGTSVPTISENDRYGYSTYFEDCNCGYFFGFSRTPAGPLAQNLTFTYAGPQSDPAAGLAYVPVFAKTDPSNHLAALMYAVQDGNIESWELASFAINDATGGISSTNTWKDMPTPQVYGTVMEISPSGALLALAGGNGFGIAGLQIFHFNGAAPITPYSAVLLPTINIDQMVWDNSNHLYALSYESNQLYVFTVTPTAIREAPGSPYKVESTYGLNGLMVVPKL